MERLIEFVTNHWMLSAAFVVLTGLLIGTEVQRRMRGLKAVGPTEATRLINHEDAVVLDVREKNEFKGGRIPEAIHIPMRELSDNLARLEKYKGRPIIAYCRSGQRSGHACSILKKNGFEPVYNLGGGILAWQNANLPLQQR